MSVIRTVTGLVALVTVCAAVFAMWTGSSVVRVLPPLELMNLGFGQSSPQTSSSSSSLSSSATTPGRDFVPASLPSSSSVVRLVDTTVHDNASANLPPSPTVAVQPFKGEVGPVELLEALRSCPRREKEVEGNSAPLAADLAPWKLTDEIIDGVCRRHKLARRQSVPRLFYAVMFGLELDMLELVLHEVAPVADIIFVTESTVTHSLKSKKLFFDNVKATRYAQFLPKIQHLTYTPVRQYKSGWDVEKRQRNYFLRYIKQFNVTDGDIVVGNIDLDELLTRETLVRMKYCQTDDFTFKLVHFRYSTNCLQEATYNTYFDTAFAWRTTNGRSKAIDLYSRRKNRDAKSISAASDTTGSDAIRTGVVSVLRNGGAWHFTAFGGVKAILNKYRNSPHTHVGHLSESDVIRVMNECSYQETVRHKLPFWSTASASSNTSSSSSSPATKEIMKPWWWTDRTNSEEQPSSVSWPAVPLPYMLTQRPCQLLDRGWFR
jgi:hypothetical protein